MLGLGDIAVPGLFMAFLAKWDAVPRLGNCCWRPPLQPPRQSEILAATPNAFQSKVSIKLEIFSMSVSRQSIVSACTADA